MQPDYEIAEVLELTAPEQLKALGDAFRQNILALLLDKAATTQQLAEALNTPTSTVAHHLQVLTEAGLTRVVQTRQVRALTQKYFGRTARSYISISHTPNENYNSTITMLYTALKEIAAQSEQQRFLNGNFGYARIPRSQAEAFTERVGQLVREFEELSQPGEEAYRLMTALYHTNLPEISSE